MLKNLICTDTGFIILDSSKKTLYLDEHLEIQELINHVFKVIQKDKDFEIISPVMSSTLEYFLLVFTWINKISSSYLFGFILTITMGLLYTKFYMDFDEGEWKQISNNPIVFETIKNDVRLEIEDTSHKSYKINFKEGGKLHMFRVTGKFRLTWDDDDVI